MLNRIRSLVAHAFVAGVLFAALAANPVPAVAADVDFSGETIEVIAPYTEGGGADVYARMFLPFLQKYLPGNPSVVIRNLPGGASILGNNRFEATAKPDGKTLVVTSSSTLVAQLLGGGKRKFDVLGWKQVIVSPQGTIVYVAARTGVTGKNILADIAKLRTQKLRYGAKQPDAGELRNILAFDLLDLDVQTIFGLARGEVRLALLRGEMEVNHDTSESYFSSVEPLVETGDVVPLFTLGYPKGGEIVRDPVFEDLPTSSEIYRMLNGRDPEGPLWEAYKAFVNLGIAASKGFALPKDTPEAVRDVYIAAFQQAVADPEFRRISGDELGEYPQLFGAEADRAVSDAVDLSPELHAWLKDYLLTRFGLNL